MSGKVPFSQSFAVFLSALLASAFVHLYGVLQANVMRYAYKLNLEVLPLPTALYHRFSVAGYALPALVLLSIIASRSGRQRPLLRQETLLVAVGVASLAWLLGCLLAWQLPTYTPVARVE
jgi:hypothetical protein